MSRKSVLSALEQNSLMNLNTDLLMENHTLSESDLSLIRQHRGEENRLGFAIQLCYMRYPGIVMRDLPDEMVIQYVASQLRGSNTNGAKIYVKRFHSAANQPSMVTYFAV